MIDEKKFMEFMTVLEEAGAEHVSFDDLRKFVDGFPKIGGWIPCSERLPEVEVSERTKSGICSDNGEKFLITDTEGYVYESTFYAVAQKFEDDAVAWQPLPEAYHG